MDFDLDRIREQIAASPAVSPVPYELAAAVVSDLFRLAGLAPPPDECWLDWQTDANRLWEEQLSMLAHFLVTTSLRGGSIESLRDRTSSAENAVAGFRKATEPLTAEMIRANTFRQEEFLRRWIKAVGGRVQGESLKESERRLEHLDYRRALKELAEAEQARKAEADARAKALREAAEREAAARGWRE